MIRRNRWAAALLSAVVVLALTGNALAPVFCPHMSGRQCCVKAVPQPGQSVGMEHNHSHHDEMTDMDMSDHAMDMTEGQMGEASAPPTESDFNLKNNASSREGGDQLAEAITLPYEPCSHCMMHSQINQNYSLRAAIDNGASYQIIAAEAPLEELTSVSPTLTFVEVHDHGPPGSSAPLYVIISSFRI